MNPCSTSTSTSSSSSSLAVLSWNVASWPTTLKLIRQHYGSLSNYLDRHRCDILLLQEAKIPSGKVAQQDVSGSNESGWESFWSCCNTKQQTVSSTSLSSSAAAAAATTTATTTGVSKRGFNGVAAFARKGLVKSACCDIFQDEELDNEGRCLVLECNANATAGVELVIFNVYVPTSGQKYSRIPFKMRFLRRLREEMKKVRAMGKKVMLCGDLNIAPGDKDVNWKDRVVMLEDVQSLYNSSQSQSHSQEDPLAREVLGKVARAVPQIKQVIEDVQIVKIPGKSDANLNSSSNANRYARKDDSFKAVIHRKKEIKIGKTFDREWQASLRLGLQQYAVNHKGEAAGAEEEETEEGEKKETFIVWAGGISLLHLSDIMNKVLEIPFSENQQKIFSRAYGKTYYAPCLIDYFYSLTNEDGMIDTFRAANGDAVERHTAWDQYTNGRYENRGVRIDFIMVDQDLHQLTRETDFYLGGGDGGRVKESSEEAALKMCTAYGNYQAAPFDGSGIYDPPMTVLDMQFPPKNQFVNGIVYTPPRYSDHVGVSLLLHVKTDGRTTTTTTAAAGGGVGGGGVDKTNSLFSPKRTRKAQPHRDTRTISSFFTQKGTTDAKNAKSAQNVNVRQRTVIGLTLSQHQKKTPTQVKSKSKSSRNEGGCPPQKKQKSLLSFLPKKP